VELCFYAVGSETYLHSAPRWLLKQLGVYTVLKRLPCPPAPPLPRCSANNIDGCVAGKSAVRDVATLCHENADDCRHWLNPWLTANL